MCTKFTKFTLGAVVSYKSCLSGTQFYVVKELIPLPARRFHPSKPTPGLPGDPGVGQVVLRKNCLYCLCYITLKFRVKQNKGLSWMCFGISRAILLVLRNPWFALDQSRVSQTGSPASRFLACWGEKAMGHPDTTDS
jgi:hypothetical protein